MNRITMRQLFSAGVHFGHTKSHWNPKMAPYLYGSRQNIHIINLDKTLPMMIEAIQFLRTIVENRGKILFVGTKYAAREIVQECAKSCDMPYVAHRWLGGMLTNYTTIRRSVKRLVDLEIMEKNNYNTDLTKKEKLGLSREKSKLSLTLGGIKDMRGLPDALFVLDVREEKTAIAEANRLGIPVVAVVDSNCDPSSIRYPIPGNDDAQRAIRLYCQTVADVAIQARKQQQAQSAKRISETEAKKPAAAAKAPTRKTATTTSATAKTNPPSQKSAPKSTVKKAGTTDKDAGKSEDKTDT